MGLPFSACYLPQGATYGVNANIFCDKKDIWWVIAYLNSSLVTYLVRGILNRSNMITSGYVSKIPLIELNKKTQIKLEKIAKTAFDEKISPAEVHKFIEKIDEILFEKLMISKEIENKIVHFSSNLQTRV